MSPATQRIIRTQCAVKNLRRDLRHAIVEKRDALYLYRETGNPRFIDQYHAACAAEDQFQQGIDELTKGG